MFNDFVQWVVVSSYAEILGSLIIIAIGVGLVYILYEVAKFFVDMYIQSKLVELYKQKDRLWDAYTSLYDDIDDLKEKTWDCDITKKKLYLLTKDVAAIEEYVLGDDKPERDPVIKGVVYDFKYTDIGYGNYLYDKVRDELCLVVGWEHGYNGDYLVLLYESEDYENPVNISVNNLREFNKWFYLLMPKELNSAGYVKEYIQEYLGINNKEK